MSDTAIRIRNYHLDGYGHVNNARYLEFLDKMGNIVTIDNKRYLKK